MVKMETHCWRILFPYIYIHEKTQPSKLYLTMPTHSTGDDVLSSQAHVLNTTLSFIKSMSLKCAVDLGIAEVIHQHGCPMPLSNLAAALSVPPSKISSISRLMRVLLHAGFFAVETDGKGGEGYILNPASSRLRERGALYARLVLNQAMIMPWLNLSSWFIGDDTASFDTAHGMSIWDYAGRNSDFNSLFNHAMTYDSDLVASQIINECAVVFYRVRTVVDVGGGNGAVVRAIARAFPHLKCTVFDLPHVVAGLPAEERVEYVGGSMFEFIPSADALLIKRVLHDFNDEECLQILRRCKEALPSKENEGKLILVEMVVNFVKEGVQESLESQLFYDMQMMVILGGKERDEQEWQSIFKKAGFTSYKITPITELLCVIEVFP